MNGNTFDGHYIALKLNRKLKHSCEPNDCYYHFLSQIIDFHKCVRLPFDLMVFRLYERANPLGSRCSYCRCANHFSQLYITYAKICVCRACLCVCCVNEWLIECDLTQHSMHIATMRETNMFCWRCNRPLATHVTHKW